MYNNNHDTTITLHTTIIDQILSIIIPNRNFESRIQDPGCAEDKLPFKRYKKAKVISVGPEF